MGRSCFCCIHSFSRSPFTVRLKKRALLSTLSTKGTSKYAIELSVTSGLKNMDRLLFLVSSART